MQAKQAEAEEAAVTLREAAEAAEAARVQAEENFDTVEADRMRVQVCCDPCASRSWREG